jgi:hypothetical protein
MSAGCSLDDAFPDGLQKPAKVEKADRAEKKKRTKGPALSFLKGIGCDPDRPFTATIPQEGEQTKEGFANKDDATVDIIGKDPPTDSYGHALSSYFGKSETDDALSQFSPSVKDTTGYTLNVEFPVLGKGAVSSIGATANTNDGWKPTTSYPNRGGVETAFFKKQEPLPLHLQMQEQDDSDYGDLKQQHAMLRKQIDVLFSRLEHMEHRRGEFSHTELGLFILTGLFLMFGLDTARKFK